MNEQYDDLNIKLESLEIKIAYQEDTIESLNQIVIQQQTQLERLSAKMGAIVDKVKSLEEPESASGEQIELPPHY